MVNPATVKNLTNVQLVVGLVLNMRGPQPGKMPDADVAILHQELRQRAGENIENNPVVWMDWLLEADNYTEKQRNLLLTVRKKLSVSTARLTYAPFYDLLKEFSPQ